MNGVRKEKERLTAVHCLTVQSVLVCMTKKETVGRSFGSLIACWTKGKSLFYGNLHVPARVSGRATVCTGV